jgi:Rod binding domain-containing protein
MSSSIGPLPPAGLGAQEDEVSKAARGLEAYLLRQVLSEVRKTMQSGDSSGLLTGGAGGATFQEMLDEALCDKMAEGPGIGLRQTLEKALTSSQPQENSGSSALQVAEAMCDNAENISPEKKVLKGFYNRSNRGYGGL